MDRIFYKPISLTTNVEAQLNNISQLTSSVRKNPAAFAVGCQFELTLYYYQLGWMHGGGATSYHGNLKLSLIGNSH